MVEPSTFCNNRVSILLVPIVIFLLVACNSSPTVPLPPPEAHVTAPDEYGYVWVTGGSEEALEGDIVLVFNESSEEGAMGTVENDGTFEVAIEADIGDTLVIQILHDGVLSDETIREVPSD